MKKPWLGERKCPNYAIFLETLIDFSQKRFGVRHGILFEHFTQGFLTTVGGESTYAER